MKVTINGDEEASPLLASEVAAGGLSPASRRLRLVRASLALSFATLILWTALLTTGAVSASLRYYTPHTSIIDIILVDALRSLFAVGVMLSSKERALTLCTYIASLSILLILAKPWVYRAWGTHPANTAALVIAALASVAHFALPYLILQIDNPPTQRLRWSAVKRILRPYFIPKGCGNKLLVLLTWVILIAGRVCQIASPIVLGMLVSKLSQRPPQDPTMLIGVYCLLNVLPKYFSEIQDTLYVRVWQRAYAEVADTTFRHMHSLSLEWHLKKKMGNVMRAMDRGLEAADTLMYYAMLFLLPAVGSALASFIVFAAHFKQAQIAAITFIGFCLYMWITLVVTLWRRKFREEMNQHDNNLHDLATDSMINFETVKQFTNEDYEAERYNAGVVAYQRSTYTSQASMSLLNVSQATTIQLAMLGSLMVAAYAVSHDEDGFDSGSFVAVQAYVLTIFQPLSYLGMIYNQIINSLVDLQNLSDLLAEQPDVVDAPGAQQLRLPKDPTEGVGIEFRDVWFKYPTQKEGQGLRGVSFVIKPGTTTAIVGSTGSGKTTTSRLLFRFYDVDRGAILVGGQDITKVTQRSLRRAIGVVPQDTCMFNSTIMANIRYGRNDATDEEVYDAARRAQLYDLVQNLELKFNTVVGERGLKLSGGEKQRVAIARCLLKDPPVVVLDEATSSLDNKTERDIQEALRCLEGRTTLVIAHRLSTIQRAHQIIVMDKGQIAERGTHDELLSRPGSLYSELWNAQVIATPTPEAADGDGAASSLAAADM